MAAIQRDPSPELISKAVRFGRARKSFFSFGEHGLTASVGATGRLIRITQHFLDQKTGICVDDEDMSQPYYVSLRLLDFLRFSRNESLGGIGPQFDDLCFGGETEHTIVNDRWPTFTRVVPEYPSTKLRVSYVAFEGTIYQKLEFIDMQGKRSKTTTFDKDILDVLGIDAGVLIRDLDFVSEDNVYNNDASTHSTNQGEGENHIVRQHESEGKHFALHLQVLDQHSTISFYKRKEGSRYKLQQTVHDPEYSASVVVLAYSLKRGSTVPDLKPILPDWEKFLEADKLLEPQAIIQMTEDHNLNFFLKSNLEYVLSVCSIPVTEAGSDGIPAVALTCGDVDGHRVATAAAFYAFQLLLLGLDLFTDMHSETEQLLACECNRDSMPPSFPSLPYTCMMKRRIEYVCKGHIKWTFQKAAKPGSLFCPNYWTNGEEIDGWETNEWLPKKSLVDTPFQIIKAADLYNKRLGQDMPKELVKMASNVFNQWICYLEKIEKSKKYAFPSYKTSDDGMPIKTFYLTDHVLIWQAVKSAESLNLKVMSVYDTGRATRYSADRVRANVIKRFTTENPLLKKRMIATKRSPTQTRFLFRSKDVALFRAMEEGFFENAEIQWTNTLRCQKHHEGNDDADWSDPRRFALAIAMARHKELINFRTRTELIEQGLSTLLSSSSSNGLFAGTLDEGQSPTIYEDERDRDNHWAIVFEVPYILWKNYCSQPSKTPGDFTTGISNSTKSRLKHMCQNIEKISKHMGDLTVYQAGPTGPRYRYGYWMKHNLPFNNVIDDNNIVELQDEWLYNEPTFFVDSAYDGRGGETDTDTNTMLPLTRLADLLLVVDVSECKPLREKRSLRTFPVEYFSKDELESLRFFMRWGRYTEYAGKRFWAFVSRKAKDNSSCIATFAPNERAGKVEMKHFFSRHETSSNFFTEETIAALNIWTTEFHVAFYSGIKGGTSIPEATTGEWPAWGIEKVAMGFRFEGDFFDRYWTCRFVVADPQLQADGAVVKRDLLKLLEQDDTDEAPSYDKVNPGPWEERRVLELMLFGRIMREMATSAGHILKFAEETVKKQKDDLEKRLRRLQRPQDSRTSKLEQHDSAADDDVPIDHNSFVLISNKFRKFQERLQMIHGDFAKVRPISDHWLNREKDRQAEQPRWTFSDESRYRSILNKLLVKNRRAIQELDRSLTDMSILAESITKELEYVSSGLESISNEESRQNNNDVKLFTYTTAIFLPLGFATGMFSMSGTPDAQTVGGMLGLFIGVFIVGTLTILHLTNKFDHEKLVLQERLQTARASLWPGRAGRAEGKPTEETNAERKTVRIARRGSLVLNRGYVVGGPMAKRREMLMEEGRGEFSMDEVAASRRPRSLGD